MNKKIIISGVLGCIALSMASCASYTLPVKSLESQLSNSSEELRAVSSGGGLVFSGVASDSLLTNGLRRVECRDKKDSPVEIEVNPNILMRVMDRNNKKTVFFFTTVLQRDEAIEGTTSMILGTRKAIPLADIQKIEIDKSRKGSLRFKN